MIVLIGLSLLLGFLNPSFFTFRNFVWGLANSVMIVAVLANGMILLGVSPYIHETVQGLMIIAAVALSIRRSGSFIIK